MKIPRTTERASEMAARRKQNRTPAELRLQELLAKHTAWCFEAEVPFGPYVADFLSIVCAIDLEVDGPIHRTQSSRSRDGKRNAFFAEHGFKVIRVTNDQVWNFPDRVIDKIADAIAGHRSRSSKRKKRGRQREARRRAKLYKEKLACPIPETFLSGGVLRAWLGKPEPPAPWDRKANPGVLARPRSKVPGKPPQEAAQEPRKPRMKRQGVYRPWQPPDASLPPLELPGPSLPGETP